MRPAARITAWAAAGLLVLGIAAGAAEAATSPAPTTPASPTSTTPPPAHQRARHAGPLPRGLAQRTVHGDLTVRTKAGYQVVQLQRGTVSAVSATSISLRSPDGFSATYVVSKDTIVRAQGKRAAIDDVKVSDHAVVIARQNAGTLTAIRVLRVRPPKPAAPTPSTSPTS